MVRRRFPLFLLAGLVPVLCCAQNSQDSTTSPANTNASTTASTGAEKTKKVWTNEEVGTLKGSISVVGDPAKASNSKTGPTAKGNPRQATIQRYREAIGELKRKIAEADARIERFRNFKADDASPKGGLDPHKGYTMLAPEEQMKLLEAKKKQWQDKIDDLEVQAKKEGIEPGELR